VVLSEILNGLRKLVPEIWNSADNKKTKSIGTSSSVCNFQTILWYKSIQDSKLKVRWIKLQSFAQKKYLRGSTHHKKTHAQKTHTTPTHQSTAQRFHKRQTPPKNTPKKQTHPKKHTPHKHKTKNTYSMDTQQHYSFVTHSYGKTHRKNSHTQKKSFTCDMIYMTHSYGKIHTQKTHTPTKNTLHGHATPLYIHMNGSYHTYKYGVATISRLLKIIGLFCRIPSL